MEAGAEVATNSKRDRACLSHGFSQSADQMTSLPFFDGMGNVTKKVLLSPTTDSIQIFPPWRSTIFLQMANPMPVPS